jgi:hypothetical protein
MCRLFRSFLQFSGMTALLSAQRFYRALVIALKPTMTLNKAC